LVLVVLTLAATALHILLARSKSAPLLLISRGMALVAFIATAGIFYVALGLVAG
jgi:hypothetical protein